MNDLINPRRTPDTILGIGCKFSVFPFKHILKDTLSNIPGERKKDFNTLQQQNERRIKVSYNPGLDLKVTMFTFLVAKEKFDKCRS